MYKYKYKYTPINDIDSEIVQKQWFKKYDAKWSFRDGQVVKHTSSKHLYLYERGDSYHISYGTAQSVYTNAYKDIPEYKPLYTAEEVREYRISFKPMTKSQYEKLFNHFDSLYPWGYTQRWYCSISYHRFYGDGNNTHGNLDTSYLKADRDLKSNLEISFDQFDFEEISNFVHMENGPSIKETKECTMKVEDNIVDRKTLIEFAIEASCSMITDNIRRILAFPENVLSVDKVTIPAKYMEHFKKDAGPRTKDLAEKMGLYNRGIVVDEGFIELNIDVRKNGEYQDKAIYLRDTYNWELKKDLRGTNVLVPTKK